MRAPVRMYEFYRHRCVAISSPFFYALQRITLHYPFLVVILTNTIGLWKEESRDSRSPSLPFTPLQTLPISSSLRTPPPNTDTTQSRPLNVGPLNDISNLT
jgi:hypothetical protein